MTITITAAEREALYEQLLVSLSGIDSIWLAVCAENFDAAQRLGRNYADDLCLIEGLGWGNGSGESLDLAVPTNILRRVLTRVRTVTASEHLQQKKGQAESVDLVRGSESLLKTCDRLLAELGGVEHAKKA